MHPPDPIATPAPAVLAYPDLPARWGVAVDRAPGRVRVVVPPVPGWRHLPRGYKVAVSVLAGVAVLIAAPVLDGAPAADVIAPIAEVAAALAVILVVACYRLRRWVEFEVTPDALAIRPRRSAGGLRAVTFRRADVRELRLNRFTAKLLLRVRGRETMEVYVSPNRAVAEYVAKTLANALAAGNAAPPAATADPAAGDDTAAPAAAHPRRRTALCAAVAAGVVAAVVAARIWRPDATAPVAAAALVLAAIVLGLALGTQEKDIWS